MSAKLAEFMRDIERVRGELTDIELGLMNGGLTIGVTCIVTMPEPKEATLFSVHPAVKLEPYPGWHFHEENGTYFHRKNPE